MRKNFNELKAIIILTILLLTIPTVLAIEKWIIPVTADLESRCGFKTFAEAILDCDNKINLTAHFINLGTVNLTAKFRADIFDSNSILIKTLETPSQNVSVGNTITFFLTDTLSTKPSYAVFIIYYDFDERGLDNPLNITQNETFKDVEKSINGGLILSLFQCPILDMITASLLICTMIPAMSQARIQEDSI